MDKKLKIEIVKQLNITQKLLAVCRLFKKAHIRFAVLKGAHLAYAYYARPEERLFSDMDILIAPGDRLRAVKLLEQNFSLRFYRPFLREKPITHYNDTIVLDGYELDLHYDFSPYHRYPININDFLANTDSFYINGEELPGLAPEYLLANLSIHALKGYYEITLKHLQDVAKVTQKRPVSWKKLYDLLAGCGATYGSFYFFLAAATQTGAAIPPEFMAKLKPPVWRRAAFSHFVSIDTLPMPCRKMALHKLQITLSPLVQDSSLAWINSVISYLLKHNNQLATL